MIKVSNWIVVWTNGFYTHDFEDHWRVFEDLKEEENKFIDRLNIIRAIQIKAAEDIEILVETQDVETLFSKM